MSYDSKNELVQGRRLKTQRLVLPFSVVGHATPGSKTVTVDDPGVLFLDLEGKNGITLALGAVDSAAELSDITFASETDTTGIFSALIRVDEAISKVLLARITKRGGASATDNVNATFPSMVVGALGITSGGDKIVLDFDTATNFATAATSYWAIEVEYQVSE